MDKNSVVDYVSRLRTKPEHVRRRIALGTAVGTTAVVAGVWFFFVVSTGTLSSPANFTEPSQQNEYATNQVQQVTTQTKNGFQELLGAVGFAGATTSPASLSAVDISTSSPATSDQTDNQSPTGGNQTVIPF